MRIGFTVDQVIILQAGSSDESFAQITAEAGRVCGAQSDVLVEVFCDAGRHARLAVGVASLPANMCLEIQAVLQLTTTAE